MDVGSADVVQASAARPWSPQTIVSAPGATADATGHAYSGDVYNISYAPNYVLRGHCDSVRFS